MLDVSALEYSGPVVCHNGVAVLIDEELVASIRTEGARNNLMQWSSGVAPGDNITQPEQGTDMP